MGTAAVEAFIRAREAPCRHRPPGAQRRSADLALEARVTSPAGVRSAARR